MKLQMSKIKPRWIVMGVVVLALALGIGRAMLAKRAKQTAASTVQTQTQAELATSDVITLTQRNITQSLDVSGSVKAVNFAVIKARVAGEVKDILVREGDSVKAGQVLARIDPTEVQRRWLQAQEQSLAAKAQMDIAQRQWDNNKALVEQGFISKAAMDNSLASYQGAVASYKAAMAGADVAQKSLDDATLRAPFAGVIAARTAQVGERIGVDGKLLELVDLNQLEVEVPLSPSDSMDVRVGQVAQIQGEERQHSIRAKVARISPSAQVGSRSVLIYLSLDQPEGLRHGLFVKGTLGLNTSAALAVPLSAVRTDRAKPYVQVVEKNGDTLQVAHRTVETGLRGIEAANSDAQIWVGITGLAEGSTVIKGQVGALREGLPVKFTAPAATAASAAQ
jgi:RND family efflux transporter MFP subunit